MSTVSSRHRTALVVLVLVLAAVMLPAVPAGAVPTVITFEDLAMPSWGYRSVTSEYAPGVTFTDGVTAIDYSGTSGFSTHSGTIGIEECFGQEFCTDPIDMAFGTTQHRVAVWVGYSFTGSINRTVVLEAFNSFGVEIAESSTVFSGTGPIPVNNRLEVIRTANDIASARVRFLDSETNFNSALVADDVEFERGDRGLTVAPNPVDFGDVFVGSGVSDRTATATATAQLTTSVRSVTITGADAADFSITGNGCDGATLPPGSDCTIDLRFNPSSTGQREAFLEVVSNAPDSPDVVRLTGTGTSRPVVTASSSSTTTTTTTAPDDDDEPPPSPTTTTTVPPTTPGATLEVLPGIGPPGLVTRAHGTGFPEGPVTLSWLPGLGTTAAAVGVDGSFVAQVLILPNDRLGRRTLVAAGGGVTATAEFLVVPRSVKPSGKAVMQVSRARRYIER